MPIPINELEQKFIFATPDKTIGELLGRLPGDRNERAFVYVVLPVAGGRYVVVRWLEVEQIAAGLGQDVRGMRLSSLPGLPEPVAAVEQNSMGIRAARELRNQQPGRRLVVLANGAVIGLLVIEQRSAAALPPDPFAHALAAEPLVGALPPEIPPTGGGTLTLRETEAVPQAEAVGAPEAAPTTPPQPAPASDERVINAWVEGHPKSEPLALNQTYELRFDVGPPRDEASAFRTAFDAAKAFEGLAPEVQFVNVLVMLDTDDFTIYGNDQQTLIVPRVGKSKNTVSFTIEPKKPGPGVIKAFFFANGRVFQKMTLTLQVGVMAAEAAWKAQSSGLTMGSAMTQPLPRPGYMINLLIVKKEGGYQFIANNGGVARAFLNLSETQIAELIARARDDLKAIVYTLVDNQYVYQRDDTTIPEAIHQATLQTLAKLGYYLYQKLFYSPGSGPDARAMGDLLRQLSQQNQLAIEIVAERFIFPWALLYDRHPLDLNAIDPEGFWGFKHIVEYTPEFSGATPVNFIPQISVRDTLGLGFVCNTTIDTQIKRPVVQTQRDFLRSLAGVSVTEYPNCQDLYNLLNDPDCPAQVLYFYCHAVSNIPGEKGGVGGSKMLLSDGAVQLDDLNIFAPLGGTGLKQAPLVFLNACQSAELSPYLYDGLVPYLVAKGARGVIGTEVDTPALFASEFAQEFLKRFVAGGQPLGELLLQLRREYLFQKRNVLGLLYALYSSSEVVVQRGA